MPTEYVSITDDWMDEYVQLPTEDDGTLTLKTVSNNFPGCCGLTYIHSETNSVRGLRLKDGCLYAPSEGWTSYRYHCSFPKENVAENSILKMMQKEATDLIVLGLPWRATEQTVRDYFEAFGKVRKVWLKKNSKGQSKGFAFVRFATYYTQMRVLTKKHTIDGRRCDVLIPHSKKGLPFKIFVGGCTEDIMTSDFRDYFSKFGEVTDVFIPKPFRAFSFVTFLDPEVAQNVCKENHIIKGVSVNVSIASPKQNHPRNDTQTNQNRVPQIERKNSYPESQVINDAIWSSNNYSADILNMQGLQINDQAPSYNVSQTQTDNVPLNPFSFPLNGTTVASVLGQAGWGFFDSPQLTAEQENFLLCSLQPGTSAPAQQHSGNFLSWLQQGSSYQSPSSQWGYRQLQPRQQRHEHSK